MSINTAAHPVDAEQGDLLALIADAETPLGIDLAVRFREACRLSINEVGLIHPCDVTARLKAQDPDVNVRRIAALWSTAEKPGGYLVKTEFPARLDGRVSKGNGNKSSVYRRWVG